MGRSKYAQAALLAPCFASSVPGVISLYFNGLGKKPAGPYRQRFGHPAAENAGPAQAGAAAVGVNFSATPFMQ